MIVRRRQMESFEALGVACFRAEMLAHLKERAPVLTALAGDAAVDALTTQGIAGSSAHRFTNRGPIRLYLETMLRLGAGFDEDPQYFWLQDILLDGERSQMELAERLHFHLRQYLTAVNGPAEEHALEAARQARVLTLQDLAACGSLLPSGATARLRGINPRKCGFVGEPALRNLARGAVVAAEKLALTEPAGKGLLFVIMFTLGAGVGTDPMYPWVASSLDGTAATRVDRLYRAWQAYLDAMFAAAEVR